MNKENNKMSCHHYNGVRGFTLIEILVVVLIIAVLATIAVSAYQRAVLKSRFSSLMPLAKTLAQGNEEYYLRNGEYTNDVNKLDIKATGNNKAQITLGNENNHKYVLLTRDDMNNNLIMYQKNSPNFAGEIHCEALDENESARWLCEDSLKGRIITGRITDGYNTYVIEGNGNGRLSTKMDELKVIALQLGDKYEQFYQTNGRYPTSLSELGMECPKGVTCNYDNNGHVRIVFHYEVPQGFVEVGYYAKNYSSSPPWNLAQGKAICMTSTKISHEEADGICGAVGNYIGTPPNWGTFYELKQD